MLKLVSTRDGSEYGNLYDKVNLYYSGLKFYVGDEIIVRMKNGKEVVSTIVNTETCKAYGLGELYPSQDTFVGFKRRASALKIGEIVADGRLKVVDK